MGMPTTRELMLMAESGVAYVASKHRHERRYGTKVRLLNGIHSAAEADSARRYTVVSEAGRV